MTDRDVTNSVGKKLESFIDFANSFIQGDETVNTIADIAVGCAASEYTAATGSGLYQWTLDLNGDCVQDSTISDEGVYVFYWKAGKKFTWKTLSINFKTSLRMNFPEIGFSHFTRISS